MSEKETKEQTKYCKLCFEECTLLENEMCCNCNSNELPVICGKCYDFKRTSKLVNLQEGEISKAYISGVRSRTGRALYKVEKELKHIINDCNSLIEKLHDIQKYIFEKPSEEEKE